MGFLDRLFRRSPRRAPIAALPAPTELRSLRPQDVLPSNWSPTPSWSLEGEDDLAKLDGASTWVFVCVHKLAQVMASFPWFVQRRRGDNWERVDDSPLQGLLEKPNEAMSWQMLMEGISLHLSLNGNSVLTKLRLRKLPVELWPIGPLGIKPIAGKRGQPFVLGYEYKVGSNTVKLAPNDVLHFMQRDPTSLYWGAGPLQLCSRAVDVEKSAAEWQKVMFQNLAVPPGVFTFDQHITKEQQLAAKAL
jgi:phage portal protein BeeE